MIPSLTLISFDLCPYVQRAAIVLAEKGVPFERVNIDLQNKPAWFLAISPLGRVPVLRVGEEVLFESAVIAEFLEETTEPRLHPADPLRRARHRAWIEFASSLLADIWTLETTQDDTAFTTATSTLRGKFERLEALPHLGPLFDGDRFHLADAAFAPVFRYFDTFDSLLPLGILNGLPKVTAWRAALAARPSVLGAVVPDYADRLHAFVLKQGGVMARRAGQG